MANVDENARLRFDLALANFQSISRAQHFYVSALLVYLALVWGWYFVGGKGSVTLQMFGVSLNTDGVWTVTPLVTFLLTLALTGAVSAAAPAWMTLRDAYRDIGLEATYGPAEMYNLDSHKNLLDYFSYLRFLPERSMWSNPSANELSWWQRHFRWTHLLYPTLFIASAYTSGRAIVEAFGFRTAHVFVSCYRPHFNFGQVPKHLPGLAYGLVCFALQGLYSLRPVYRWVCRCFGIRERYVNETYEPFIH